ncbi:putative heme d1 biosynthesis radical SAM protein NirJ2 [Thermanaeromonas toyohensis ToBE]|uniref:Putative heme d1 biosynthesis radical SAM protein NirJ2 n=1 Tax=Thermanaeromonas toyohensis ToBE TaxID=698762 RepID=A0A1W1VXR9_9FIRM|nr:putative heme d1 biosynthesis radical SAM protein NirJ2 [Thermanaeromonas toyohensis]SMB98136.1 putative heme d1 biosynthesis radical SAM protein NirJ2 [Thermanaeromonas toyohensis ToBE]
MLISWNTTNQCNLYCDHCYRDSGAKLEEELSYGEAKELIKGAVRAGFRLFIFSGGEPLLRPDLLDVVAYAVSQGLRVVLGSNGTLLTPELARELKKAGVAAVGISLDSCEPIKHDRLRRKEGAWEKALAGMEACRSAGLPFQVHTTVFDWNREELTKLTDLAVSVGAKAHHFFFLVPTGRAATLEEEAFRAAQYEETIRTILVKQQQVSIELKPTCAPQFMRLGQEMGLKLPYQRGCLAGIAYCLVGPRGDLQPCAYLNLKVGNIREVPLDHLWRESEVLKRLRSQSYTGVCGRCRYRTLCGGCRARAYCFLGDYMAEDPWCRYNRGTEQVDGIPREEEKVG